MAASNGNHKVLEILLKYKDDYLESNIDPAADNNYAIHWAVINGD